VPLSFLAKKWGIVQINSQIFMGWSGVPKARRTGGEWHATVEHEPNPVLQIRAKGIVHDFVPIRSCL
jgi:hypothetical protein